MTNNEGGTSDEEFRNVAVVDRANTTMAVWMGTSMACAQCHTHKYEPITQKEYFQFFAFFNNTADADRRDESPLVQILSEEQKSQLLAWDAELTQLETALKKTPDAALLAKLPTWEAALPKNIKWNAPKPRFLSWADLAAKVNDDGSILVSKTNKTDTYTVEFPFTGSTLSALQLEALPHDSLPGKGPGFSGGNFVISKISASIVPPSGTGRKARYLRIELPGKDRHLMLAEVQAFVGKENVALKGTATQSSIDYDGAPARAIDNNTNGKYFDANSVTHTKKELNPWWQVDLNSMQDLDKIVVWNRTDGFTVTGSHLNNFKVILLDEAKKVVWEETVVKAPNPNVTLSLNGSRAVPLAKAFADYSQMGFEAENVFNDKKAKQKGWAIGGDTGKPHTLTLIPDAPVAVPEGSRLIVTIEQSSTNADHLLGHFRVRYSSEAKAAEFIAIPQEIQAILAIESSKRTAEQQKKLGEYVIASAPETKALREKIAAIEKQRDAMKPATTVPVFEELPANKRRITKLQFRGSFMDLGDVVTEGVPAELHALPKDAPKNRLGLAEWLVAPENPLTARVTVNRYWEQIFGTGLVRTSEEFGSQGELPSHPDLLDWLAVEFANPAAGAPKWDMKRMLKLLVMSGTYRQSSRTTPELIEKDPDNRFLARGPRHRLSAEMIRDQALAVSGLLSEKMYGQSVRPIRPSSGLNAAFGGGLDWATSAGEDRHRRGLYTEWRRTSPYPSMVTFDAPSREACTIRRNRTNTPLQALVTLNDPVYIEAAQGLGRLMATNGKTPEEKIAYGFRSCMSRMPSEKETARLLQVYEQAKANYAKDSRKAIEMATNPIGALPKDADATELAAWTIVSNVLMNLDEFLMRR